MAKKKTILTFLVGCTLSINNYTYARVYICKRSVTRKILFLVKFYEKPPLNKQSRLKFQQASDHIKGFKKWRQNMISSFLPSVSALWIIHQTSNRFWWIIIMKIPAVRFTKTTFRLMLWFQIVQAKCVVCWDHNFINNILFALKQHQFYLNVVKMSSSYCTVVWFSVC